MDKNNYPPGPYIIGQPGGPAGPFWSLINQQGNVIAMQITSEDAARLFKAAPTLLAALERLLNLSDECDFVEGTPEVCPGETNEFYGGPCHWCQARAAIAEAKGGK